jgi:hypothetical protein
MSREPALLTSAGRMPERSQHRVSGGQRAPIRVRGLVDEANVRRRGMGSPEPWAACSCSPHDAPYEEIAARVLGVHNLDRGC